jgi:hypothetical protein
MDVLTWVIELGVGVACLVIGTAAIRGSRLRVAGIVLVIAGLAASGHALIQL